jgi:eukaryotic-like serine/threonine-protein kinase
MAIKLTAASFLTGVKQSGLIDPAKLDAALERLEKSQVNLQEASAIAESLVAQGLLTTWQSEKLLQGRHKGFLLGRYRLLSLLGAGEMSAVYLAEHVMMGRRCAIKVLPANKVQDTSYLGRFHREARAVAALNHPNIVRAYDVDQQSESGTDIHFLVMEYVEGENLGKLVQQRGPLDFATAVEYIRQAAEGLQHAHVNGLIHRDIKPENLLIDRHGQVRLLDLGLARFFNASEEESLTIKHDEKVLGTADYLAPEQAIDSHSVDLRADVYSLGCTLYYALAGHPPFTEGSLVQRLMAHQTKKPPSIRFDRPDAPDDLLELLDKMMAKRPADRYQSAAEVSFALGKWLVQHASDAWRQQNLSLVAAFGGLVASTGESSSQPSKPATTLGSSSATSIAPAEGMAVLASAAAPALVSVTTNDHSDSDRSDEETADAALASSAASASAEGTEDLTPPPPTRLTAAAMRPLSTKETQSRLKPGRTTSESGPRRAVGQSSGPQSVVVAAAGVDWERTLAIGLLSLGTVVVIMLGVWLFTNQTTLATAQGQPSSATSQLESVPINEPPQTSERTIQGTPVE